MDGAKADNISVFHLTVKDSVSRFQTDYFSSIRLFEKGSKNKQYYMTETINHLSLDNTGLPL